MSQHVDETHVYVLWCRDSDFNDAALYGVYERYESALQVAENMCHCRCEDDVTCVIVHEDPYRSEWLLASDCNELDGCLISKQLIRKPTAAAISIAIKSTL